MNEKKWKKRWRVAKAEVARQEAIVARLAEDLVAERARSTLLLTLVDRPSDAEVIIKALAEVFNPRQTPQDFQQAIERIMLDDSGLDDMAGVKPGENFPDVEFDDFMDPSMANKEVGVWTASETQPTPREPGPMGNGQSPLPDPTMNPNDGTPRFRSGSSAPPPVGGTE